MKANQIVPGANLRERPCNPNRIRPDHILVVEDDGLLREHNVALLLRSGYAVDAAEDGAAAWEALSADGYDLLLTDNSMPKVSGIELLKKLRAARMALPVIMATGTIPRTNSSRPWLQPAATLLKPYTGEEMLRAVEEVLREADSTAATYSVSGYCDPINNDIQHRGNPQ